MMHKTLIFLCSLCFLQLRSGYGKIIDLGEETPQKIILLTVPKAGTDLIAKALKLITGREIERLASSAVADPIITDMRLLDPANKTIGMHHLFSSFDFIKNDKSGKYIKIIQIRDPRDLLLSQISWTARCSHCWYAPGEYNIQFNQLSFEERLMTTILYPEKPGFFSMRYFLRKALEWMQEPDVFVSRFENLVGPLGGGDRKKQERAIRDLARHMNYHLDQEDVERIAEQLFGGTGTFKTGQIGNWRTQYTPYHLELFYENLEEELILLGYSP
jgi:hypothetical protein